MAASFRMPRTQAVSRACLLRAALAGALLAGLAGCSHRQAAAPAVASATPLNSVELTATQLRGVSVTAAAVHTFALERTAVGVIDFDQDRTVQVSPPYQGRMVRLSARAGDRVRRGQLLFTIDSPDLVQAESTVIAAAGTLELNNHALQRAKALYAIQGLAQKDYEQVVSDQQAAEGAYRAARDALHIFGKSDTDIDRIVQQRQIEPQMPIRSPIDGVVTARNAAEGMLVQPGASPAPFAVADVRSKWMLADVPEADAPSLAVGEPLTVKVLAFPERTFVGHISQIAESVDPNTHRVRVRSQLADPHDELRAQMFATFVVRVGSLAALGVPYDAVVREGDGTMTVWVTTDRHRFQRRTVRIGQQQDGYDQVLAGLQRGELVAASGALFISTAAIQDTAQ
jgi:cobalt-zinc-cadmium efflux system membrane fusion protein